MAQLSLSGRQVYLLATCQGQVYWRLPDDPTWTLSVNDASPEPPLNFSGVMSSTPNQQRVYYADGVHRVFWDAIDRKVHDWTASAGDLPIDTSMNYPRLNCTWRGREVEAGLLLDPQSLFASKVDDPSNWDYAPVAPSAVQAWAMTLGQEGLIGDIIVSLCPYNDDVLLVWGQRSLTRISGDPADGGVKDIISPTIGGTWMNCWARDPLSNIYFLSQHLGVYMLPPGGYPQLISQPITQEIKRLDTGLNIINVCWNVARQELCILSTPAAQPGLITQFVWEQRTGAWWFDEFANPIHNPLCTVQYDGNEQQDRVLLMGGWDGYVRNYNPTAANDDGTPVSSEVVIGPVLTKTFDEVRWGELIADLGETSGDVTYEVLVGRTAEEALGSDPVRSGTLSSGRSSAQPVRRSGHAIYVRLSSRNRWAMDRIRIRVASTGMVRARRRG